MASHIQEKRPRPVVAAPQPPIRSDWILANPWLWLFFGLLCTGLAFVWARLFDDWLTGVRFTFLVSGLLLSAGGLMIRMKTSRPFLAALPPSLQRFLLGSLFLIYAGLALGLTGMALAFFFQDVVFGFRQGSTVVVWFVVVPASVIAAQMMARRLRLRQALSVAEETSIALLMSGLALFLSAWALYLPTQELEWDTMRLFLAVFAAVAMMASVLPVLPLQTRWAVLSSVIVLHFAGIGTAVVSAPPFAWITAQLWTRIYRPYLEFMYLNNAYHFYSPEPGPASFVWFRLEYSAVDKDGKEVDWLHWVKMPEVYDDGTPQYLTGLTYQRLLSFTENVSHADQMPPTQVPKDGQLVFAPFYQRRMDRAFVRPVQVGQAEPRPGLVVPFANVAEIPLQLQYLAPTRQGQRIIESYARHVCRMSIPDLPDNKVTEKRVKIYRVTHAIPNADNFRRGQDPQDPRLYRAIFLGEFDDQGKLLDAEEPFLYWLLPNLADRPDQRLTPIISYVRKHARDPNFVYLPEKKQWVDQLP